MAQVYGHAVAKRFQRTPCTVRSTEWTKLEGSTALANRFGIELYNKSQALTVKLYLTMTYAGATPTGDAATVRYAKAIEVSAYHFEPLDVGITLWGRTPAKTARVIVTEYGVGGGNS